MTDAMEVLLLISTGCPHCAVTLEALSALVKKGEIATLQVVNVSVAPAWAQRLGVRSVPWLRMGVFEFDGAMREPEIRRWIGAGQSEQGVADYLEELLGHGQMQKTVSLVKKNPAFLASLLRIVGDAARDVNARIGVVAVMESLRGDPLLQGAVPVIATLTHSEHALVRADAAYLLSLTNNQYAVRYLTPLLQDPAPEVREIAKESLLDLQSLESK